MLWMFTIPCGSGLAREGVGTFYITGTGRPLSRASSLPQVRWDGWMLWMFTIPCGSELAREGVGTFYITVIGRPLSRASPLPQVRWGGWILWVFTIPCGSGLAREGVGTFYITGTGRPLSRASPLPQGVGGARRFEGWQRWPWAARPILISWGDLKPGWRDCVAFADGGRFARSGGVRHAAARTTGRYCGYFPGNLAAG